MEDIFLIKSKTLLRYINMKVCTVLHGLVQFIRIFLHMGVYKNH
jgi:hypothetical protein